MSETGKLSLFPLKKLSPGKLVSQQCALSFPACFADLGASMRRQQNTSKNIFSSLRFTNWWFLCLICPIPLLIGSRAYGVICSPVPMSISLAPAVPVDWLPLVWPHLQPPKSQKDACEVWHVRLIALVRPRGESSLYLTWIQYGENYWAKQKLFL